MADQLPDNPQRWTAKRRLAADDGAELRPTAVQRDIARIMRQLGTPG